MHACSFLAPLALVLCVGCPEGPGFSRVETKTLPLARNSEIRVKGFNGRIRVETWDREEVELTADIREAETNAVKVRTETGDRRLTVIADRPGSEDGRSWNLFGRSEGVAFTLRVPASSRAFLETSNGSVSVAGTQAPLEVRTSNGRVEVKETGPTTIVTSNASVRLDTIQGAADVSTSNGRVEVESVQGDARIRTSNGSIQAQGIVGKVVARTSNGRVEVRDIKGSASVETSNGSLRAEQVSEDFQASTSNAAVELRGIQGAVDVRTSHGSVQAEDLDGKGRGIRLKTSNASITFGLGQAKGHLIARTSSHSRVNADHPALRSRPSERGELEATIPGSDQTLELTTSHGTIRIH